MPSVSDSARMIGCDLLTGRVEWATGALSEHADEPLRAELCGDSILLSTPRWIGAIETDNGAMIACAGFHRLAAGERTSFEVGATPGLALT